MTSIKIQNEEETFSKENSSKISAKENILSVTQYNNIFDEKTTQTVLNALYNEINFLEQKRKEITKSLPVNIIGNSYILNRLGVKKEKQSEILEEKLQNKDENLNQCPIIYPATISLYSEYNYPFILDVFKDFLYSPISKEDYMNKKRLREVKYRTIQGKTVKQIGITGVDILSNPKYRIRPEKMPKFGVISDAEIVINSDDAPNLKFRDGGTLKHGVTNYKAIESQSKEALNLLSKKREKYKNLSRENKEKMDNFKLTQLYTQMVNSDIPKNYRLYQKYRNENEAYTKRLLNMVQKEVKKKANRLIKSEKECQIRARKLQKEMLTYWKRRERELVDVQKRRERLEMDKKRKEEELHEQKVQKKRMEYLLKQSDLYSFMMYKHLGAFMPKNDKSEGNAEENAENDGKANTPQGFHTEVISGEEVLVNDKTNHISFSSINVQVDSERAQEDACALIEKQRLKAAAFDANLERLRNRQNGNINLNVNNNNLIGNAASIENDNNKIIDNDSFILVLKKVGDGYEFIEGESKIPKMEVNNKHNINFKNQEANEALENLDKPEINNLNSQLLEIPKSFIGDLKEYQLKGLRWLDNLYEQGINGILADEMGLGKTIQAISFLAHLSEDKGNWGPFLIIAPNTTLYNWQQEFSRFCPSLRILLYWGALKERKTLRKFFTSSKLYAKDSAFHVCITSYQLVVCDEKVFSKINWSYMILDEAQAIKNINSQRWNILLNFSCRNRLLLSGTPIQNSMSELWALLHFIMPNLFDSHEQFQDWFSRDIEAHSQEKGKLNAEQLRRLHQILKPFMLRRVKKDVADELGEKEEIEIFCKMTEKQKILYNSIKQKLNNISDLFQCTDSKVKVANLMNLVMQFRKVCNHPELFERNMGKISFIPREKIGIRIPKMIYDLCFDLWDKHIYKGFTVQSMLLDYLQSIYLTKSTNISNINKPKHPCIYIASNPCFSSLFSPFPLLGISNNFDKKKPSLLYQITLLHFLYYFKRSYLYREKNSIDNKGKVTLWIDTGKIKNVYGVVGDFEWNKGYYQGKIIDISNNENINYNIEQSNIRNIGKIGEYRLKDKNGIEMEPLIIYSPLLRKETLPKKLIYSLIYVPKCLSAAPEPIVSSQRIKNEQKYITNNIHLSKIFFGTGFVQITQGINKKISNIERDIEEILDEYNESEGIYSVKYREEGLTRLILPSFPELISSSAKLRALDELLIKLRKEGHRALVFCQMTRMLDILEEYMSLRGFAFFRMDGHTPISVRRDMINEFQTDKKVFAFLLSTRAGGLGVNLTGADTVIFYDNDWNPTMDAQATDRAHRIGQTKKVTVYRLLTEGTVEERILKRARQKQNVQTTVYSGGAFKADFFKQSEILSLLYSEDDLRKLPAELRDVEEEGFVYGERSEEGSQRGSSSGEYNSNDFNNSNNLSTSNLNISSTSPNPSSAPKILTNQTQEYIYGHIKNNKSFESMQRGRGRRGRGRGRGRGRARTDNFNNINTNESENTSKRRKKINEITN